MNCSALMTKNSNLPGRHVICILKARQLLLSYFNLNILLVGMAPAKAARKSARQ
jgi:hypothetical protein